MTANNAPVIRDLKDGNWIDLVALGNDNLIIFIKYIGIKVGDAIWPNIRGCAENGEVHDHAGARVVVTIDNGYDPVLEQMTVQIPNALLMALDQGWLFGSYAVELNSGLPGPESLRIFCYVGERPATTEQLSVVQIKESHDLFLDPGTVPSNGAACIVAPYQAMAVGDEITFKWVGYYGGAITPVLLKKTVQASDLGRSQTFLIDQAEVYFSETAEASYRIKYADGRGADSESQLQVFTMSPPSAALLPPLKIKNYDGGLLNPNDFPDGAILEIDPAYAGIRSGDVVLAHCTGPRASQSLIKSVRVDPSTVDARVVQIPVEQQWLLDNIGTDVTLQFQYGRGGAAQSSEPLVVRVKQPLELPAPSVEGANSEGEGNAWWSADTGGAYVVIPAAATFPPGAKIEVHWWGNRPEGQYIALDPVTGNERRFLIPASAIPANMSADESKRFSVFYRITPTGEQPEDSSHLRLRIEPIPLARYPEVQCVQALGNQTLPLSAVTAGADLYLGGSASPAWPFMARGQLVTISATGVALSGGGAVSTTVRDAKEVTQAEFNSKKIEGKLAYSFLNRLARNQKFSLHSSVSFDGGNSWQSFNINNKLTLTN